MVVSDVTCSPKTRGVNAITLRKNEAVKYTDESLFVVRTTGVANITANEDGKPAGYTIDGTGPACNPKEYGADAKGKKTAASGVGGVVIVT